MVIAKLSRKDSKNLQIDSFAITSIEWEMSFPHLGQAGVQVAVGNMANHETPTRENSDEASIHHRHRGAGRILPDGTSVGQGVRGAWSD